MKKVKVIHEYTAIDLEVEINAFIEEKVIEDIKYSTTFEHCDGNTKTISALCFSALIVFHE